MSSIINKLNKSAIERVGEYIELYNEHNAKSEQYLKLADDLYTKLERNMVEVKRK